MQASFRVFQLLRIRNQISAKWLRGYGLYFALILFIAYHWANFTNNIGSLLIPILVLTSLFCGERQFFPQVKNTMNSIHFLTMPSQQSEKWLAELIHTFFIIPIIAITPFLAAVFVLKLLHSSTGSLYVNPKTIFSAMKIYWLTHPLLFFGAIYFRNSVIIKTFGSVALLAIASALIASGLTNIFPPIDYNTIAVFHTDLPIVKIISHPVSRPLLTLGYFVFFWVMSYLSLLELESK